MPSKYQRIRVTVSVQRRAQNFKMLIDAFRAAGRLTVAEVCELLAMSKSGGRKYVKELREFGAVHVVGYVDARPPNFHGFPLFAITSEKLAAAFLEDIALPADFRAAAPRPARVPSPPGTHVHLMKDDVRFEMKRPPVVVHRDPLIAAFFGPARAEVQA